MSDLHQSRRCNFLFKGNLKEEESGISFLFSSLRGSRFKSNPAPSDGGEGGRDDSAGTRETTRLTDSHSNINRNMAAPEGESSAEERKSSSTPPPKKNFTAANQNVFLFNSSSLVASFSLPVALCTQNSAYWLGLFEARSPTHTHTKKNGEEEIFPCHNGIECGSPEEEGLRGLYGSVGAVLCGEWIQQVPTESQPRDRHSVARDNVASQQLNSGGFGVV